METTKRGIAATEVVRWSVEVDKAFSLVDDSDDITFSMGGNRDGSQVALSTMTILIDSSSSKSPL